jgi:hypothetical protein
MFGQRHEAIVTRLAGIDPRAAGWAVGEREFATKG